MKKIVLLLFMLIIGVENVLAIENTDSIYKGENISDVFIRKIDKYGNEKAKQGTFIRRSSDNQFVYCLEPFIDLINNYVYKEYQDNYASNLGISDDTWQKISLIAYYGYQYENHQNDYWYYITQVMIWQEIDPEAKFYFTDSLGGENNPDKFKAEILEIENLVNNHYKLPNIENIEMKKGESLEIVDSNKVLHQFKVLNNDSVTIDNDTLKISKILESQNIKLVKSANNYEDIPIVYIDPASQDVLAVGNFEPVEYEIKLNVTGCDLVINKKDKETNESIKMSGIIFELYDEFENFIASTKTNSEGIAIFKDLKVGKYKVKESDDQIILGYAVNNKFEDIEINSDIVNIDFYNEKIKGNIIINKVDEHDNPLSQILFGLYNEEGLLLDMLKTDEKGEIIFKDLTAGKYIIKELSSIAGFIKNNQEYIVELLIDQDINIIEDKKLKIINYLEKGNIIINKTDSNNNPLEGVEFTLYDKDMKALYNGNTNENGQIIIEDLYLGNYYLKEVNTLEGYMPLTELISFSIRENEELVTINVTNEKIKIRIPDTGLYFNNNPFILPKNKKIICK